MKNLVFTLLLICFIFSPSLSGQSWTAMKLPEIKGKYQLRSVHFPSAEQGWAVGYNYDDVGILKNITLGTILHYKDGAWTEASLPVRSDNWTLHGVWFLNNDEGWTYGQDKATGKGLLLHYKNGTWKSVDLSFVDAKEWVLYDLMFMSEGEGYAVGGTEGNGPPVMLQCSGSVWSKVEITDGNKQTLLTVSAQSKESVAAAGYREGELRKTGAGRAQGTYIISKVKAAWEKAKVPLLMNNMITRKIVMLSEKSIYAVGWMPEFGNAPETGKVLHYDGKKWAEVKPAGAPKEWNLFSLAFESPDKGWAVGNAPARNKGLLISIDKGKWTILGKKQEPQFSFKWRLYDIAYDGKGAYYAVGADYSDDKGLILKSQ